MLIGPREAMVWLTPGAGLGLTVGATLLAVLFFLPATWRIAVAGMALMAGAVLVNLAPANPVLDRRARDLAPGPLPQLQRADTG